MRRPVDAPIDITTGFGVPDANSKFSYHTGLDFAKPIGSNVFAPVGGTVTFTSEEYNGNVAHVFDGKYYHRMMHMLSFQVNEGQLVKEGQHIGLSGNTGLSTGPHVHWDVCTVNDPISFNQFIDPNSLLNQGGNMPTLATEDDVKWLAQGYFTTDQVAAMGGLDKVVADNVGTDLHQLNQAWANSPQFVEKRLHYEALDAGTATNIKPYSGPILYTKE